MDNKVNNIGTETHEKDGVKIVTDKNYNQGYIVDDAGVYVFEIMSKSNSFAYPSVLPYYNDYRRLIPMRIGNFAIIPQGEQNNLPDEIALLIRDNHQINQVLYKTSGLIWGQGPELYETKFVRDDKGINKRVKEYDYDAEIQSFLNDWDYLDYIRKALDEFVYMRGHFTQYIRNKGARIGAAAKINRLEHIPSIRARLSWHDPLKPIDSIIVGDFERPYEYGLTQYPIFDIRNPFQYPISVNYSNLTAFATDGDYARFSFEGLTNFIKMSNTVAKIILNFNLNAAAITYHIKSPAAFWDLKKRYLEEKCVTDNVAYTDKILKKYKTDYIARIAKSLSGINMVGKMIHTEKIYDEDSNSYVEFTIEPVENHVKDYFDAQINVSKHASLQTTAGMGLHPAITGLSSDGNLPSGSEQLYAFKFFLLTSTDIPERIICRDINNAIKANFPNSKKQMGFYHDTVMTEEQTAPKDRVKNN